MKNLTNILSALAIAVALAMANTSCTTDDSITEVQPATPQKVHITVGAGIGGGSEAATRSLATKDGSTWTLTFTEGDKIYFCNELKAHPSIEGTFRMAATLTLVPGSISADGKSATFAGDATFYKQGATIWDWDETDEYTLQNPEDPMLDCKYTPNGYLVHNGCTVGTGCYQLYDDKSIDFDYSRCFAADVKTLMESAIEVKGNYNYDTKCFNLAKFHYPIFNCTISGLTANTTYYVGVCPEWSVDDYNDEVLTPKFISGTPVTTDGDGKATFAINVSVLGNLYWALWFEEDGDFYRSYVDYSVFLGQRDIETKVYNITATAEVGAPTI